MTLPDRTALLGPSSNETESTSVLNNQQILQYQDTIMRDQVRPYALAPFCRAYGCDATSQGTLSRMCPQHAF